MRPSSYAGPHHTIGLPVLSPTSRLNQTLPTSSANSTLERPMRKQEQSKKSDLSTKLLNQKSPPPAVPILNLRPKNNGLLTTIEQAAMSDEEPSSPTISVSGQGFETPPIHAFRGSSRIPTPKTSQTSSSTNNQPNYENVAG